MNSLTLPAPRSALNPRLALLILPVLFFALALMVMLVFSDAFAAGTTPPPRRHRSTTSPYPRRPSANS